MFKRFYIVVVIDSKLPRMSDSESPKRAWKKKEKRLKDRCRGQSQRRRRDRQQLSCSAIALPSLDDVKSSGVCDGLHICDGT